ncbi:PadR family transcriptional regulator (plasmid) [Bacillus velezensis]|uniref:PadR family transcriptional regulator n=1 Tax=Bacillus velezensis TaxID=492670 RepID=UPI0004A140B5|nr:PadR family transcriptional regulator [Bacillus velezensis]KDN91333.1 PadR family transcriptional regulator [Bacillus amyloliquefaciens]URJ76419.1 PadR family transcriptional regulator [Bacillus velezensis]URJ80375.1 PadR family transcriptional regulator [Bacillus velezensis]
MNSQIRKGAIELCVLSLIQKEDLYGYDIIKKISERFPITGDTIYPILRRLTKNQYLSTYTIPSPQGPKRKYYKITSTGKAQYGELKTEWLNLTHQVFEIIKED